MNHDLLSQVKITRRKVCVNTHFKPAEPDSLRAAWKHCEKFAMWITTDKLHRLADCPCSLLSPDHGHRSITITAVWTIVLINFGILDVTRPTRKALTTTRGSAIAEEARDALRQLKYYGRFLTGLLTRSSANPEEPCEHTVSWNRIKCCTNVQRIACENVCNRRMTFKVIQGHCHCHHLIGHILFAISLPL